MECPEISIGYRPVEMALTLMLSALDLLASADRVEAAGFLRQAIETVQGEALPEGAHRDGCSFSRRGRT